MSEDTLVKKVYMDEARGRRPSIDCHIVGISRLRKSIESRTYIQLCVFVYVCWCGVCTVMVSYCA